MRRRKNREGESEGKERRTHRLTRRTILPDLAPASEKTGNCIRPPSFRGEDQGTPAAVGLSGGSLRASTRGSLKGLERCEGRERGRL